jgi:uncharacterized membrane protein YhaH (DUF805 family)
MDNLLLCGGLVLIILLYLIAIRTTHGRSARFEYGTKFIVYLLLNIMSTILYDVLLHEYKDNEFLLNFVNAIYCFVTLVIIFCHSRNVIKRFHDMGKPSIFALTVIIPILGLIWPIIAFFADSQDDLNKYDESIDFEKLFPQIIEELDLIVENNLTLIKINDIKVFIKKENYRYTIVARADKYYLLNNHIRECSPKFILVETKKYNYCKKIRKNELEKIIRKCPNVV